MQARLARSANPTRDSFDGTLVGERPTGGGRAPTRGRETVKLKAFVNFTNESSEAGTQWGQTRLECQRRRSCRLPLLRFGHFPF